MARQPYTAEYSLILWAKSSKQKWLSAYGRLSSHPVLEKHTTPTMQLLNAHEQTIQLQPSRRNFHSFLHERLSANGRLSSHTCSTKHKLHECLNNGVNQGQAMI
jgi:hypothetical protein